HASVERAVPETGARITINLAQRRKDAKQLLCGFARDLCYITARRKCQSVAVSNIRATRSSFSSANGAAINCSPIGNPPLVNPHGRLRPGIPARLALIV